jgi:uncharacterized protein
MPIDPASGDGGGAGANVWVAASDGDVARVVWLLDHGTSVDARDEHGYSPLCVIAHVALLRTLLPPPLTPRVSAALGLVFYRQAAVSYGHVELTRLLLARGANPNLGDQDDDTPLHVCETAACAQLLLDAGAAATATNADGLQVRPAS